MSSNIIDTIKSIWCQYSLSGDIFSNPRKENPDMIEIIIIVAITIRLKKNNIDL